MIDQLSPIVQIEEIGVEAAEIFAQIHQISFKDDMGQRWREKDFSEILSIIGTSAYVISLSGNPIGFTIIRKIIDEAEIITFCILPKWCNNGYATRLLEWVIKDLQEQSIKRLFLEVRENNHAAIRLYSKCSFVNIGKRAGYYNNHQGGQIDALVFQRQLIV